MSTTHKLRRLRNAATLGIFSAVLLACGQKPNQQQAAPGSRPVSVTTTTVQGEIVTVHTSYPANVVALRETELRAEVSGYLTRSLVADGASVSAGQALYEIDKARFEAALIQAKANHAIAEANFTRIERDVQRYENLASKDAIARQTLDNARTELQNAAAQKEATHAAVVTAQLNLDRSVIRAPFSGLIGIAQVRQGALVSAGSTLINSVSAVSPIAVEFQVGENELPNMLALRGNNNALRDSLITFILGNNETYPLAGKITTIDRAVNRGTGTVTVRAEFDNPKGMLLSGMRGILQIRSTSAGEELVIPYKAVTEQLGQTSVYVVGDSSKVDQRIIKLGSKFGEQVVVKEGLAKGEEIVVDGLINVRHGSTVVTSTNNPTQE